MFGIFDRITVLMECNYNLRGQKMENRRAKANYVQIRNSLALRSGGAR